MIVSSDGLDKTHDFLILLDGRRSYICSEAMFTESENNCMKYDYITPTIKFTIDLNIYYLWGYDDKVEYEVVALTSQKWYRADN